MALCVRGLEDESPAARLAAAAATGTALSAGVEGSAAENERLGVIAARDQVLKCEQFFPYDVSSGDWDTLLGVSRQVYG